MIKNIEFINICLIKLFIMSLFVASPFQPNNPNNQEDNYRFYLCELRPLGGWKCQISKPNNYEKSQSALITKLVHVNKNVPQVFDRLIVNCKLLEPVKIEK